MGLGTCLIGFAVAAMKHDADIRGQLGIPPGESLRAVIALGYPGREEIYQGLPGRNHWSSACGNRLRRNRRMRTEPVNEVAGLRYKIRAALSPAASRLNRPTRRSISASR